MSYDLTGHFDITDKEIVPEEWTTGGTELHIQCGSFTHVYSNLKVHNEFNAQNINVSLDRSETGNKWSLHYSYNIPNSHRG